jgi:quercetin dioxygenase-like cupin family protein
MSRQLKFSFSPDQKNRVHATGKGSHTVEMNGAEGVTMTGKVDISFTVDFGPELVVETILTPEPGYVAWVPVFGSTKETTYSGKPHQGEIYEYVFVTKGILEIAVGDKLFTIRENEFLKFEANHPHGYTCIGATIATAIMQLSYSL